MNVYGGEVDYVLQAQPLLKAWALTVIVLCVCLCVCLSVCLSVRALASTCTSVAGRIKL